MFFKSCWKHRFPRGVFQKLLETSVPNRFPGAPGDPRGGRRPKRIVSGRLLGLWGGFWGLLGPLGVFCGLLEAFWDLFGIFEAFWAVLGPVGGFGGGAAKIPPKGPGHKMTKTATRGPKSGGLASVFGSPSKTRFWATPGAGGPWERVCAAICASQGPKPSKKPGF